MARNLRVGIAGYGVVGKRRRHFIDRHPRLETVAVSDAKLRTGQLEDGVRCYDDYRHLLSEDLDILFVSVPSYIAPEATIAGLENGWHVFCEKPPGRDIQDVLDVIKIKRTVPLTKLKYGFNHRYHDSIRDALKIIQDRKLGKIINIRGVYGKSKIISFESDWRTKRELAGGGILLDQGIHMLDMMRMFVGEFEEVHSFVTNRYWNHDVEDNAYALMRTSDGIVASMHSSATQWRHTFRLEIALEQGLLVLRGILSGSKSYGDETITVYEKKGEDDLTTASTRYTEDNSWRDEIEDFVDAIVNDVDISTGNVIDALKTMNLVYQIYCADPEWSSQYEFDSASLERSRNLIRELNYE